jgi:hypothetical protein
MTGEKKKKRRMPNTRGKVFFFYLAMFSHVITVYFVQIFDRRVEEIEKKSLPTRLTSNKNHE